MSTPAGMEYIADGPSRATFGDGALPTNVKLPNAMLKTKAAVTTIKTSLEVVWYKPHRNIWLHYMTKPAAEAATQALNGAVVNRYKLTCNVKPSRKSGTDTFTAHISHAIEGIELHDLTPFFPALVRPVSVVFGAYSYSPDTDDVHVLRKKIEGIVGDPIKDFQMAQTSNPLKRKAFVIFESDALNLAISARALNGLAMKDLGGRKIFVTEYLSLYVAIDGDIYSRRSKSFKGIANTAWKDYKIRMKIFDGSLRHRRLTYLVSIKGIGREAVKEVKALIDSCVTADAMTSLQFATREPLKKFRIELKFAKDYKRAVNGGIARLEGHLGKENVVFDDNEDLSVVTYNSTAKRAKIARGVFLGETSADGTPSSGTCPICCGDAHALLELPGCGHTACPDCLQTYCSVDLSNSLPLKCFVDLDCTQFLPSDWLAQHLPNEKSRALFRDAIHVHCQEDPASFMRCTGPDCSQYLSISPKFCREICPSCLTVNCTSCRRPYHFNETCEEHQADINMDDEAVERHLTENGGKRCPRCNEPSIKVNGCNHMQCPACHVHYCWQCLEAFPTMGMVYRHMDEIHGTNGLEDAEQAAEMEMAWQNHLDDGMRVEAHFGAAGAEDGNEEGGRPELPLPPINGDVRWDEMIEWELPNGAIV